MAEKKKPFSITEFIKPEDVSNLDTTSAIDKIVGIPIEEICENEKNFYDTSNVAELINSIALNGLLEPIIVMPAEGEKKYKIISGHRRFKAFCQLHEEDSKKYAQIPAIIKTPKNEVLEELILIEANRATRVMSSADTLRQAERYKDLLVNLKEQGVEIPGRLRDIVAEAMQISASRLARLEVIRKNLCNEAMSMFEKNTLNESISYELAQASVEVQEKILAIAKEPETMTAWQFKDRIRWVNMLSKIKCKDGHECANRDRMFAEACKESNRYSYLQCVSNGKCCKECSKLYSCQSACKAFADDIKKQKAKDKQKKSDEKRKAENEHLNQITENNKQWLREGYARRQAGVTYEDVQKVMREVHCYAIPPEASMKKFENGYCDDSYCANLLAALRADDLTVLAKLYKCSADYLLGLSDELITTTAGWRSWLDDPPVQGAHVITLKCNQAGDVQHYKLGQGIYKGNSLFSDFPGAEDSAMNTENIIGWIPFPEMRKDDT